MVRARISILLALLGSVLAVAPAWAAGGTDTAEAASAAGGTGTAEVAAAPASARGGADPAEVAAAPSRAKVLEVQHLFQRLGYPLGTLPLGGFGPRTQGALRYFQHKFALPVTGRPDARTLQMMRRVADSLRGAGASGHGPNSSVAAPHDLVEEMLGNGLPILGLAVVFAALLGLLAVSARERPA